MPSLTSHLRTLAVKIGPRPSTKEGERKAAGYIAGVFSQCGLEVETMPFRSVPSFSYTYGAVYLAALGSAVLLWRGHPLLAGFLSALCVAIFYLENTSFETVSRLLAWGRSQNVLGKIPPRKSRSRKRLAIVSAHYDSSRSGLSFHPKIVGSFRGSFLTSAWALRVLPLLCLLSLATPWGVWLSVVPSALCALGLIMLIQREVFGEYVAGANDNASGTAILLGLAEELAKAPLKNTEVWLLATGCEEAGLTGMIHFVRKYGRRLESASCINIDLVGQGTVSFMTEEGMIRAFPSDPPLLDMAGKVSRSLGNKVVPGRIRMISTDAVALLARGYSVISLMGFENGRLPNWHWRTDTIDNIDSSSLTTAYSFVKGMLQELDSKKGP